MLLVEKIKTNLKKDKRRLKKLVTGTNFDMMIMSLILFNAVILGLLTSEKLGVYSQLLFLLDRLCLAIFIAEMFMKIFAFGKDFFKSGWNVFDLIVVLVSAVSVTGYFVALRTFRLFLMLRYFNRFNRLKQLLSVFVGLLPSFGAMLLLFLVFFYVSAIVAVSLFGQNFIDFATLENSLFTLLQLFTLDGWVDEIARPLMAVYPSSWIFFVVFLFVSFLLVVSFLVSAVAELMRKTTGLLPKIKF